MKTILRFVACLLPALLPASAAITCNGSGSWIRTASPGTFDASNSDKLVVVVSGEHNFANNSTGNGHLELGVTLPGTTGPVSIPASLLSYLPADPDDTNDNNLPDSWEQSTGLKDSFPPGAHSEYGDPDNDGISNFDEYQLSMSGSNPLTKDALADGLTRDTWTNVTSGWFISDFTSNRPIFLDHPNETAHVPGIDDNARGEYYGSRYRGFITAPVTGNYRFWIAGNKKCELWLADGSVQPPDASAPLTNRFGKQRIALNADPKSLDSNARYDFDQFPGQRSRVVYLIQDQPYYIEALHKQRENPAASRTSPTGTFTLQGSAGVPPALSDSRSSAEPLPVLFNTPGTHTLTAVWTLPGVNGMDIEAGSDLTWAETTFPLPVGEGQGEGAQPDRSFTVDAYEPGLHPVLARLPETGDIIARGTVNAFTVARVAETADAQTVEIRPDGTRVFRFAVVAGDLPENVELRLSTYYQGAAFSNGGRDLVLRASDFGSNGIADVFIEWSGTGEPSLCHSLKVMLID